MEEDKEVETLASGTERRAWAACDQTVSRQKNCFVETDPGFFD